MLVRKEVAVEKECKVKETSPAESGGEKEGGPVRSKVWEVPAAPYSAQYHDAKKQDCYCANSVTFSV